MLDEAEIEARLERSFASGSAPREGHRDQLEERLLAAFDRHHAATSPKKERPIMKSRFLRRSLMLAAAAAVLGVVACAAPVDVDVDVGRTLSIRYEADAQGMPSPKDVAEFLRTAVRGDGRSANGANRMNATREVGLRVSVEPSFVTLDAEIWGSGGRDEPFAPRLVKEFPALANAEIKEEILHGKVRGSIAMKLGHELLDLDVLDHDDVETARQKILAQLRAKGLDGKMDVRVEGGEGERKVIIQVEKQEEGDEPPLPARP